MGPTLVFIITTAVVIGILIFVIRAADSSSGHRSAPTSDDQSKRAQNPSTTHREGLLHGQDSETADSPDPEDPP